MVRTRSRAAPLGSQIAEPGCSGAKCNRRREPASAGHLPSCPGSPRTKNAQDTATASDFTGRVARGASQTTRLGGTLGTAVGHAGQGSTGSLDRTERASRGRRLTPQPSPGAVAAVSFSRPAGTDNRSTPAAAETSTRPPEASAHARRGGPRPAPSGPALSVWSAGALAAVSPPPPPRAQAR